MHAVARAGRASKARISPIHMGLILASGMGSAQAQEGASPDKKAAVDQLERLMSEQQGLQMRQTQQLQSIRQQLDEQTRTHATQDWQWAGSLALVLLLALSGMWLANTWSRSQWVTPWARWQQGRAARQQERQARREQAATEQMLRFKPTPQETPEHSAEPLGSGGEIDHSGPGALGHLLRRTKLRRALKRSRREEKGRHDELLGSPLSEMPTGQSWLAVLDEPDSQLLADEAVREFELRRAVGLQSEPELPPASAKAAERQHAIDTESAWQEMQEISLAEASPALVSEGVSAGATVEAGVDVSIEVQRVRSGLRARREQRNLKVLSALESTEDTLAQPSGSSSLECDIALNIQEAAMATPTSVAAMQFAGASALAVQTADVPEAQASATPQKTSFVSLGVGRQTSNTSFSISSLPAHTEAETRLALGYEFQKLGQYDEAAQLYEEVLSMGSAIDQTRARQLLSALPGR